MILYHESLKILKDIAQKHGDNFTEQVDLAQSLERVLAEDLRARESNPPFDNSSMDGFAINTADITAHMNASNEWIPVHGIVGAGDVDFQIERRDRAVEIMTGAPIPEPYFDSVVRIEDVHVKFNSQGQKMIKFNSRPVLGENIRRKGDDTQVGDVLLSRGERISCEHLLALATQGISQLKVRKQIKVGILSTGKEIVDFETRELRFGQIRNSTGVYLEAALAGPLFKSKNYGIVPDEPVSYIAKVKELFEDDVELLISTGAVSMGVYDFVRPALESLGAKIHFHKCAIRPGKPILFATVVYNNRTRFVFGVPGNPVSTAVGLRFFIRPFVDFLLQKKTVKPSLAVLVADSKKPEGLRCFFKAKVSSDGTETTVESLKGQASFMVSPLLESNAWVVFPEDGALIKRGTPVEVFSL